VFRTERWRVGFERVDTALACWILLDIEAGKWLACRSPSLRQPDVSIFALDHDLELAALPPDNVVLLASGLAEKLGNACDEGVDGRFDARHVHHHTWRWRRSCDGLNLSSIVRPTRDQWSRLCSPARDQPPASRLYNGRMRQTRGYHWVKSGHGLWMPGDERGSWSEAWDDQIGFIEPHTLHEGDPVRLRMAEERMKHPPVRLSEEMIDIVARTIGECVAKSNGGLSISALAIEPTHIHVLIQYSGRDIHTTVKWLADQTTKAIHKFTSHQGPVWCKGKWCEYVFEPSHWMNLGAYIRRHNERAGRPGDPYSFITPIQM
jgi:hypothetical protein